MPDDEYMLFCCNDLEHPCNFRVQAKTKEEVMEHAKTHLSDTMTWKSRQRWKRRWRK